MLISDNSSVRINYIDSNSIQTENARILARIQINSFQADVVRSQMFTSDVMKARNMHAER